MEVPKKKRHYALIIFGACLIAVGAVNAAPSSNAAWIVETYKLVKYGDPAIGVDSETIETEDVDACADCHGLRATEPDRERRPTLAGQVATYTFKQLRDHKDGTRANRRIAEGVEHLTNEQLAVLAAWYASQPLPFIEVDEDEIGSPEAVRLVYRRDTKRLVQPCVSRHRIQGKSAIIDVPAIVGQNVKYFVETTRLRTR